MSSDLESQASTSRETPEPGAEESTGKRKCDRKFADIWLPFTNEENPQKLKSAICKNCKLRVNYHKKSEYIKNHLLKCIPFKKLMYGIPQEDRPDWFPSKKFDSKNEPAKLPTPTGQKVLNIGIPILSESEKKKFNTNMFFYKTGTSFVRVEDEHLAKAINICRPGTTLPTRKQLATGYLDACYKQIKEEVQKALPAYICILSDACTHVNGEPIVNYLATSPSSTFFIESVSTGTQTHSGQWIADDLCRVIESFNNEETQVAGAVTDNTAANKAAWRRLEEKYPNKFFHGCVCHCLNLLVKHIFGEDTKQRSNKLPLGELSSFTAQCKTIVVFFKSHHALNHELRHAQRKNHVQRLVLPAKTRWSTLLGCLKSLLASEDILHTMVHAREFVSGTQGQREIKESVRNTVADENFVTNLEKCIFILEPISQLTTKFQGDNVPVSDVYAEFTKLPEYYESDNAKKYLKSVDVTFIKNAIKDTFKCKKNIYTHCRKKSSTISIQ